MLRSIERHRRGRLGSGAETKVAPNTASDFSLLHDWSRLKTIVRGRKAWIMIGLGTR